MNRNPMSGNPLSEPVSNPTMTAQQLDDVYSSLCATMSQVGEADAALFLGRFALLAIVRLGDAGLARQLIGQAAAGLPAG